VKLHNIAKQVITQEYSIYTEVADPQEIFNVKVALDPVAQVKSNRIFTDFLSLYRYSSERSTKIKYFLANYQKSKPIDQ